MSLFGALMGDIEEDPFFGSQIHQMNNMMNSMMGSMFSDPFGMFGGHQLAIGGPRRHGGAMMPFMPQMPSLNRLFSDMGDLSSGSSFSSSTVVMSSGPNGKPQVYSASSSTKLGPNGVKETRKSVQDSRTGLKKMSIGHHIGERAHVVEREQNVYSGEREERQEFINLEEEEAEDFDREFQSAVGGYSGRPRAALPAPPRRPAAAAPLALPAAPAAPVAPVASLTSGNNSTRASSPIRQSSGRDSRDPKPSARRPLRNNDSVTIPSRSATVREIYSGSHPQRQRHRSHKPHHRTNDN